MKYSYYYKAVHNFHSAKTQDKILNAINQDSNHDFVHGMNAREELSDDIVLMISVLRFVDATWR